MGGIGSGRTKSIFKKNNKPISKQTKQLRYEIFSRIELSAPWIFSPLREESIKKLKQAVDTIIEKYK